MTYYSATAIIHSFIDRVSKNGWPGNSKQVTRASVTAARFAVRSGKVFLFGPTGGSPIPLSFTQDGSGLHVTLPSGAGTSVGSWGASG